MSVAFCGKCGSVATPGHRFCNTCGAPFEASLHGSTTGPAESSASSVVELAANQAKQGMANISGSLSSGLKGVSEWDGFSKAPAAARESLSKTKDLISKGWLVPILLSVVALLFVFAGVSAAIQGLRTTEASVAFDAWAGNEGPSLPLLAMATNAALHNPVDIRFDLENFVWVSGSRDLSGRASVELPMTLIGG